MKICRICGFLKELDEFHIDKNSKDGRQAICKICRKKYNDITRLKNAKKVKMAILVLKTFEQEYPKEYKKVIQIIDKINPAQPLSQAGPEV
jgi:hypothetical protein